MIDVMQLRTGELDMLARAFIGSAPPLEAGSSTTALVLLVIVYSDAGLRSPFGSQLLCGGGDSGS